MLNSLIENNVISEKDCGTNFSYILNDNSNFLSTEYKVLQSQGNSCFVKCMKMLYNGKFQIYYMTKDLKPFSSMISTIDPDSFLTIVANLFMSIINVKNNGFLSCQNIDINFEKIYVDSTTLKVSLIYLPLNKNVFSDYGSFENELRTSLVKLINALPNISSPKTIRLAADLSNGMLSIEELYIRIKGGKVSNKIYKQREERMNQNMVSRKLCLYALNAPAKVKIVVTKDNFVIGKKAELCDGVVSFNRMISRSHCRINKVNDQYTITDLNSANGTFVNKTRVAANQTQSIKNGDIIRLADSDFQVVIQ